MKGGGGGGRCGLLRGSETTTGEDESPVNEGGGGGGRCGLLRGSETTTCVTVRAVNVHYAMRGWMAEHSYKRMYNSWAFILYRCAVTFTVGRSRE